MGSGRTEERSVDRSNDVVAGPSGPEHWYAEVRALRADTRARRSARIDAARRAGCTGVHFTSGGAGGATLTGAAHVELARQAAELGLLYGVAPIGPRQLAMSEPWADYWLLEARDRPTQELTSRLGDSGRPVWLRVESADVPRALEVVDALVVAGCRRIVVVCTSAPWSRDVGLGAIAQLRRESGLDVGWSEATGDQDLLRAAHRRYGARHLVVRVELEGEGRPGLGLDPSEVAALRAGLAEPRRPSAPVVASDREDELALAVG
ncbi:MAG: hypothetical protein R3F34_18055 [Planctomycetota bacterium]